MGFTSNKKTPTAVTQLTGGTPSTVWFANANGIVQELPIGAAGTVLTAAAPGANPTWTTPAGGGGGGVTAHGALTGLTTGDDHTQYHTDGRGDARYSLLAHLHTGVYAVVAHNHDTAYATTGHNHDSAYAAISHSHTFASLTSRPTTIGGYGITDFNSLGDARWSLLAHDHTGTYSLAGHDHAGVYSPVAHLHTGVYSLVGHDHAGVYAPVAHGHVTFTGDTGTGGTIGNVPAPVAGDAAVNKFLKADGTWATLPLVGSNSVNPDDANVIIAIQMFL